MSITALRTPDDRFQNLPDFPCRPHFVDDLVGFESLRMHYVDEGARDAGATFLCLHGEPTWAYLYRKMIPVFSQAGYRVICPDFLGFGRSDKPVDDETYTYSFHRNSLMRFFERMQLRDVCLVVQDWGGILGLTLPMEYPEQITRLIVMNTALPAGESPGRGFSKWKAFVAANPDFEVAALMQRAMPFLTDAEAAAYAAPFPDSGYMAGVRRFPDLVMVDPTMDGVEVSKRAIQYLSSEWSGGSFMAIGIRDPVLGKPVMDRLHGIIRGCPEPLEISEAGHFVPEWGDQVALRALHVLF